MSSYLGWNRPLVAAVLTALRALSREIDRLDESAAKRFGVNRTDLRCLELLGSAGALTPTALARALGVTTGGMTAVIDRLERAGYARRRPDPHDRRKVIVEATDLLAARQSELFGDLLRNAEALIATYSDAQLETIRDFVECCRAVLRAHGDRISGHSECRGTPDLTVPFSLSSGGGDYPGRLSDAPDASGTKRGPPRALGAPSRRSGREGGGFPGR